jgi:hypothetical protein
MKMKKLPWHKPYIKSLAKGVQKCKGFLVRHQTDMIRDLFNPLVLISELMPYA